MAGIEQRREPLPAYRFHVELGNIIQATFSECSGLEMEVDVHTYEEGGENRFVHKLAGRVKYADLTLHYGSSDSDELWAWHQQVCRGIIEYKNISILMYDWAGHEVRRWELLDAYPVRWVGPQFNAEQNSIAIENLTIAHRGVVRAK